MGISMLNIRNTYSGRQIARLMAIFFLLVFSGCAGSNELRFSLRSSYIDTITQYQNNILVTKDTLRSYFLVLNEGQRENYLDKVILDPSLMIRTDALESSTEDARSIELRIATLEIVSNYVDLLSRLEGPDPNIQTGNIFVQFLALFEPAPQAPVGVLARKLGESAERLADRLAVQLPSYRVEAGGATTALSELADLSHDLSRTADSDETRQRLVENGAKSIQILIDELHRDVSISSSLRLEVLRLTRRNLIEIYNEQKILHAKRPVSRIELVKQVLRTENQLAQLSTISPEITKLLRHLALAHEAFILFAKSRQNASELGELQFSIDQFTSASNSVGISIARLTLER